METTNQIFGNPNVRAMYKLFTRNVASQRSVKGERFFDVMTYDGSIHELYERYGLGFGRSLPEGADPLTDSTADGHKKNATLSNWHNAVDVTEERLADDKDFLSRSRIDLEDSRIMTQERAMGLMPYYSRMGITTPLVNGLPIVDATSLDGLTYFNTAHTYLNSNQTYSNMPDVTLAWSVAGLQKMTAIKQGQKDSKGNKFMDEPLTRYIVGDGLLMSAGVTLRSEDNPETANRSTNPTKYANTDGTSAQTYVHWSMLGDSEFLGQFRVPSNQRGWLSIRRSGMYGKTFQFYSPSGRRMTIGWIDRFVLTGNNPREFITSNQPT